MAIKLKYLAILKCIEQIGKVKSHFAVGNVHFVCVIVDTQFYDDQQSVTEYHRRNVNYFEKKFNNFINTWIETIPVVHKQRLTQDIIREANICRLGVSDVPFELNDNIMYIEKLYLLSIFNNLFAIKFCTFNVIFGE